MRNIHVVIIYMWNASTSNIFGLHFYQTFKRSIYIFIPDSVFYFYNFGTYPHHRVDKRMIPLPVTFCTAKLILVLHLVLVVHFATFTSIIKRLFIPRYATLFLFPYLIHSSDNVFLSFNLFLIYQVHIFTSYYWLHDSVPVFSVNGGDILTTWFFTWGKKFCHKSEPTISSISIYSRLSSRQVCISQNDVCLTLTLRWHCNFNIVKLVQTSCLFIDQGT